MAQNAWLNVQRRSGLKNKKTKLLWLTIGIAGLLCFIVTACNPYIQYDESYTLSLIRHPVRELIRITSQDVHPPFYYLLVKIFSAPFGGSMWAVRAFNLLPLAGMFWLGRTLVSKLWGERAGLWFSLLSILLPANMSYLLPEMRMYGLVSFLEVCAFLAGFILLQKRWEVLAEWKAWIVFFVTGLLDAYTHYYALIGITLIYLWVGGGLLYGFCKAAAEQKDKRLCHWGICVGGSILLYLPWLFILLAQFGEVKEDYWIGPITVHNCISYVLFPIYSSLPVILGVALAAVVFVIFVWELWRRSERLEYKLHVYGLFVYVGVILIGVAVSVLIRPVFSVRYVKCGLGILTLCLACLFASFGQLRQKLFLAAFGIFALFNLMTFAANNRQNFVAYGQMQDYVKEHFSDDAVLVYETDGHYMGIFSYWFRDYINILPDEYWEDEYDAFTPQLMSRSAYEEVYGSLAEQDFWVVDVGNVWMSGQWNGQRWDSIEHCEPFVFHDQTDIMQCMFSHLAGQGTE